VVFVEEMDEKSESSEIHFPALFVAFSAQKLDCTDRRIISLLLFGREREGKGQRKIESTTVEEKIGMGVRHSLPHHQ
jgi:hypothetical protein